MLKEARIGSLPGGKYRVYSKDGKNLGTYNSYGAAKKRLTEIEMFKHMKKKKRKADISSVYQTIKLAEDKETTSTYSAVMRDLRKNNPDKVRDFMKSFKEAFHQANSEKLDDVESVALLQALQHIDREKSDDTKDD